MVDILLLFLAGVLGGTLNSIAGGGSFITFPALLIAGVPPVSANATNTFASCSGYLSGAYAFRKDLLAHRSELTRFVLFGVTGGALGAWLLLQTTDALFREAIPWLLLFAMLLFVTMDGLAKQLVGANLSAIQVIAVRSWIIIGLMLLVLGMRGQVKTLHMKYPGQSLARGVLTFLAPYLFFTSLQQLPLADATVVFFSSSFFLIAGSALFLKERIGPHRWSAVMIGFVGVVIAINPTGEGDLLAYLMVLGATIMYSVAFIWGKRLSEHDSVLSLVFSLQVGMGLVSTVMLPWVWEPMSMRMMAEMTLMALIALAAHYLFTSAFARAEVSVLAPFEYTALLWAVLIGYLVWGDFPDQRTWIGASIIIAAGLYVIHRETLHQRNKKTVTP